MSRLILLLLLARISLDGADDTIAPAFVARLQEATSSLSAGDGAAFTDMMDYQAFTGRILHGLDLSAKERRDFIAGLKQGLKWGDTLLSNMNESGSYLLMRTSRREGRVRALFRLITNDSTLNYHDTEFTNDGPDARVTDIYIYTSGEELSATMRPMVLPMFSKQKGFDLGKLLGLGQADAAESFLKMTRQFKAGDHAGVIDTFASLPEHSQKTMAALMLRLRAAQQLGNDVHLAAIQDLVAAFPQNRAMDFLMIDAHLMKKEWDQCLACIDRLERTIGGDPYLDSVRASVLMDAGQLEAAREKADACVRALPDLAPGWWMLVTATLRQKDHRATADLLLKMQERFALEFGDLTDVDEYKHFVASAEYKTWMKAKEKRTGAETTPP